MSTKYDYRPFKALTWIVTFGVVFRWAAGIRTAAILPQTPLTPASPWPVMTATELALAGVSLVGWALFLAWIHRAARNAHALAPGELSSTPGWAVAGWLIPFVNLVMPYQVMAGLWRSGDRRPSGARTVPGLLLIFWLLWLGANLLNGLVVLAPSMAVTAMVSNTAASALWLWFVWNIEERQACRLARLAGQEAVVRGASALERP